MKKLKKIKNLPHRKIQTHKMMTQKAINIKKLRKLKCL